MAVPVWNTNDVPTATDFNVWLTNVIAARKTANESVTSSTVMQNDDELFVSVVANSVYEVSGYLRFDGATAADVDLQFTGPAGATFSAGVNRLSSAAATTSDDVTDSLEDLSTAVAHGCLGVGVPSIVMVQGILIVAGTAGTFRLQWCQHASSATASRCLTRSYITLRRVE
jgi:hypothetical protein